MYREDERQIFEYELKAGKVKADPLSLRRKLLRASAGQFYTWLDRAEEPEELGEGPKGAGSPEAMSLHAASLMSALEHQEMIVRAARDVFGMPEISPQTGEGYTEAEVWSVLGEYLDWLEKNGTRGAN